MDVEKLLASPHFKWEQRDHADREAFDNFRAAAPANLPNTYLKFMRSTDGGRGEGPFHAGWVEVWPVSEAIARNEKLGTLGNLPGFFAFGSDGNGRLFLFDIRQEDGAAVCSVPAEKIEPEHVDSLAGSFSEFLQRIVHVHGSA
jgi:hypothetical protein